MQNGRFLLAWSVWLIVGSMASAQTAGRVELELALEQGFAADTVQRWTQMLAAVGTDNFRLGGNNLRKIEIETTTGINGVSYRVYGVVTARGELLVPGGRFRLGDRAGLAKWVQSLKTSGPPRKPGEKPAPFGMTAAQLDLVLADLARVGDFSTAGLSPTQVLTEIGNRVRYPIVADPAVGDLLAKSDKVPGELKGLACGTIAAAVLRRDGLSLIPRRTAPGGIEYLVQKATDGQDVWPIGWPPERPLPELLPDLFTLRDVEIPGNPASQVLQIVADRVKLPMLFDEQGLLVKKLDPSKATVKIPLGKMGYEAVLDRAMFQAGLKHEVRVDDAGKPFLWITTR